jgi:hypothetical protein
MATDPPEAGNLSSPPETISETEKLKKEWAFRDCEIAIKQTELKIKEQARADRFRETDIKVREYNRSRWTNPLVVAIFPASLAAAGNAVITYLKVNVQRASDEGKASRDATLEDRKAEFSRILEVIKLSDDDKRTALFEFLIHHHLITDQTLIQSVNDDIVTQHSQINATPNPTPTPTPNVTPSAGNISKNFEIPAVPALDGQGNAVGVVGPSHVHVEQIRQDERIVDTQYTLSSQFYNGSGTQHGSQNVILIFTFQNGDKQQLAPIPLDRTRCFYSKATPFTNSGTLNPSKGIVSVVEILVSPVSGVQTPC